MTSENGHEPEERESKEIELLTDLRYAVRSIDSKVEEILDELKEELGSSREPYDAGWDLHDFYGHENDGY